MRLLLHSDSVCASTGFARVARTICRALPGWEIVQVGIQHPGPLVEPPLPNVRVIPAAAAGDPPWGFSLFRQLYLDDDFDLAIVIQDLHVTAGWAKGLRSARRLRDLRGKAKTPVIHHFPVDGPMLGNCEFAAVADVNVTPLPFSWDLLPNVEVPERREIPHTVDCGVYKPLPEDERVEARRRIFGMADPSALAILWMGTNIDRKDPFVALQSVLRLQSVGVQAKIHMHTRAQANGQDIHAMCESIGLSTLHVSLSDVSQLASPDDELNVLFNAADVLLNTSRREGFGIPVIEAMAAGTHVVAPKYGPFEDLLPGGRLFDIPALTWLRGDNRGPSWQAAPKLVANTLSRLVSDRNDAPAFFAEERIAWREAAIRYYDEPRVQTQWVDLVLEVLE